MSDEDERDLVANQEEDADRAQTAQTEQPALPTAAEVVAYAATWGETVDEVAAWLRDHNIHDHPDINDRSHSITESCVVAMGLRAHFPALDATADQGEPARPGPAPHRRRRRTPRPDRRPRTLPVPLRTDAYV
jgi:hypothetical protein